MPWYDETGISSAPAGEKKIMLYTTNPLATNNALGGLWGSNNNVPGRNFTAVYESDGTTLAANQNKAEPGQIVKYDISFTVPSNASYGKYRNYFQPSLFQEPNEFNNPNSFIDVTVIE